MAEYWKTCPRATVDTQTTSATQTSNAAHLSDFNRHRQTLLSRDEDQGWQAELQHYWKDISANVSKDTDIVENWQVEFCL